MTETYEDYGEEFEDAESSDSELSFEFAGEELEERKNAFKKSSSFYFELKERPTTSFIAGLVNDQHLKEIIRELGLIKLCRVEVPKVDYDDIYVKRLYFPPSYKQNTKKEKVLLWHAENFRQQFHFKYPNRRPLMMARNNECSLQKMVCTTIRPTNMKFPEFRTWQGCGSFVSDFLKYEELENPVILPEQLYSPQTVLKRQTGHTYEFSTVLASFLIGSGYDAYVVSGYATREVCKRDQSRVECPFLLDEPKNEEGDENIEDTKYFLKKPVKLKSKFLEKMKNREVQKQIDAKIAQELAEIEAIKEFEKPPPDDLWGWRLHSWVLVLPSKDVLEPFFIEPTTGLGISTDDPQYIGIESIWNHQNYWVLVQFPSKTESCKDISFDLNNPLYWERLLIGEPLTFRQMPPEVLDADTDEFLRQCIQVEKHLDMPPSWVEPLKLSHSEYENRFPNAKKVVFYRKAKYELFSPYSQSDGLVERVSRYNDYDCRELRQMKEMFAHRQDRMYMREKDLANECVTEKFTRGREDALKGHVAYPKTAEGEEKFSFYFYHEARLDGMSKLDILVNSTDVYFVNRPDRLYLLRVNIESKSTLNFRLIKNAIVKFYRNPAREADRDKAEVDFRIAEKRAQIKFHYGDENLTYAKRTFLKPAFADKGARIDFDPSLTFGFQTSPLSPPLKPLYLYRLQVETLRNEDAILKLVREKKEEIAFILRTRNQELANPTLIITEFDIERNSEAKQAFQDREQEKREMKERHMSLECDFLAPYYVKFGISPKAFVNRKTGKHMVQECLQDWKNLLVARANDIQSQFEDACQEFHEKNDWYEQNQKTITKEEEEAYFEYCKKNSYYLHILEVRLNRHKELAPARYKAIHSYLSNDPRLAAVFAKVSRHKSIPN